MCAYRFIYVYIQCRTVSALSVDSLLHKQHFANADAAANADGEGSTIALPGLHPGELKKRLGKKYNVLKDNFCFL